MVDIPMPSLSQRVNDVSESHASLYAAFESHRTHCATDKSDMKSELRAINGKLWAGLILLVLNLLAFSVYLATEGTPWEPRTVLADRGERE